MNRKKPLSKEQFRIVLEYIFSLGQFSDNLELLGFGGRGVILGATNIKYQREVVLKI